MKKKKEKKNSKKRKSKKSNRSIRGSGEEHIWKTYKLKAVEEVENISSFENEKRE